MQKHLFIDSCKIRRMVTKAISYFSRSHKTAGLLCQKSLYKEMFRHVSTKRHVQGRYLTQNSSVSINIEQAVQSLNIAFFVNKNNSLSQRVARELSLRNHQVSIFEIGEPQDMVKLRNANQPDIIICPFLTKRVPDEICRDRSTPCLIVHPGVEGDRGASSLDWALLDRSTRWGVTVLQASEQMDAGDIWSTLDFPIERQDVNTLTKSSLYANEVTMAAAKACIAAVESFIRKIKPRPLDYALPHVYGRLRPNMKKVDRLIDWKQDAETVASHVRMSDSAPGAVAQLHQIGTGSSWSSELRLFGAHIERSGYEKLNGCPGEIIGQRDNAVLVKCGSGAIWISHIKMNRLKLPAKLWLENLCIPVIPSPAVEIPLNTFPTSFQDIWTTVDSRGVCELNFDFYNGAMGTSQCRRLEAVLKALETDDRVKVIVLKGGYNFFSNGIHLNLIEHAARPDLESWENINAINDVVRCIFSSKKLVVAALQGNAGAGGVMMAIASDVSIARKGVILNPHYKLMHLYGSEYHTYFLPKRVGAAKARELLSSAAPILSEEATAINLIDAVGSENHVEFNSEVKDFAASLTMQSMEQLKKAKALNLSLMHVIERHRQAELSEMAKNFTSDSFTTARKAFVYH